MIHRALILVAVSIAACLAACGSSLTVEQQVIATIREMEAQIEAGERRHFLSHIADDFSGQHGGMNREQVRALVVLQLSRYKRLQGQLFPIQVEETGEGEATAQFRALVTGGPGWIPENGQLYDFDTRWRLVDGDWLVVAANWDPVL